MGMVLEVGVALTLVGLPLTALRATYIDVRVRLPFLFRRGG